MKVDVAAMAAMKIVEVTGVEEVVSELSFSFRFPEYKAQMKFFQATAEEVEEAMAVGGMMTGAGMVAEVEEVRLF